MKISRVDKDFAEFLHYVSSKKKELSKWQFLHIAVQDPEQKITIDEIEQFLKFHIQSPEACLLVIPRTSELLLFTSKDRELTLNKFEKAVYENFSSDVLRARVRGLDVEGLEAFSKILEPHISPDDVISYVAFKRMSRPGNCIFVLDDDIMVLKQMEKILGGFGHVVTSQIASDLSVSYIQYAPDILFLDIHLGKAKGNELLKKLKHEIDPHAHVVMISSDTNRNIVMDIKKGGAKGFVVKPFDRNKLYQEVMKAPTIVTRSDQSVRC